MSHGVVVIPSTTPVDGRPAVHLDLTRDECLRLLATAVVGRLVVTDGALPAAHPVAYLLDDEEVVFRTGSGSKLAAAARHKVVAFEVDEIDLDSRSGWWVLGVGEADEIVDPARLGRLAPRFPASWVPVEVAHVLTVPLQKLTGRRTGVPANGSAAPGARGTRPVASGGRRRAGAGVSPPG